MRIRRSLAFEARQHCILIGSFMHAPNVDAARWCKQAIWPLIRKALPAAELHCYGSYGDKFKGELHAPKLGFHFKGRAEDALATMANYRLNLAPLRYGAGLKGKVFDGFQTGTPTVTTPIGAEGVTGAMDWGCPISSRPATSLPTPRSTLYARRRIDGRRVQAQGQQHRDGSAFDAARVAATAARSCCEAVRSRRATEDRQQHFTGRMLRHHHHRSTEFMSRWIEAKNR